MVAFLMRDRVPRCDHGTRQGSDPHGTLRAVLSRFGDYLRREEKLKALTQRGPAIDRRNPLLAGMAAFIIMEIEVVGKTQLKLLLLE